ncbi:RNA polymerase [Pseudoneurospora amorphoporcata]|uniref:Elongator complex protein 2 n=1 Tax=Pseudoneurospora amorphoporcata TaxID=241081 RepID=A0AAN6SFU8_9PEZI|nr:RNA polymerase [Pseudoneurospora amorphoporcata]
MTETAIDTRYLSAGANRYAAAADWGENGLVAFGADINVCLWNPSNTIGISQILSGHTAHVRAVKFLPRLQDEKSTYLVSGGDDQSLRVWAVDGETGVATCVQIIQEHTAPINYLAALKIPVGSTKRRIFVSGAADSTVKVWSLDVSSGPVTLLQTIKTAKKYFPLALALSPLNDEGTALILAIAGTTNIIQILTASTADDNTQFEFTPQATLPGHENWIRSLDFIREKPKSEAESDVLLASASQDKYIRIWRIHQGSALSVPTSAASDASAAAAALTPGPANKIHKIKVEGADPATNKYCIMFEALLLGHEDWIYTARWCRSLTSTTSDSGEGTLQLLSASADNSLSIWESDPESGIWITVARLGEVSREKGATTATGSIGGFWTGMWSLTGTTVITLGRTGSWRRWDWDSDDQVWKQNLAVSGHTRAVTGISWSRNGVYLLSTSSDQTTRLHAEWATNPSPSQNTSKRTWHEMARPQIHGYDLNCIDSLSSTSFVSGADEKLMRVFTEPKAVARMLNRLTGSSSALSSSEFDSLPADAANIPVLGLSNKAIDVIDDDADASVAAGGNPDGGRGGDVTMQDRENMLDPASMVRKSALEIDHPPFEESLSRHTLWPEVEKLYGHGYEISCLAVSHPSEEKREKETHLIASACRAASLNHAVIRLFETDKWTELRPPLKAHTSTIHRLRFSSDNTYLLSVGKDRQWAVFKRDPESSTGYTLLQLNPKGHSRMILDCAWAPKSKTSSSEGVDVFATAGRDKAVKIWVRRRNTSPKQEKEGEGETEKKEQEFTLGLSLTEDQPVTALDFASEPLTSSSEDGSAQNFLLAVGTESGKLSVLAIKVTSSSTDGSPGVSVAETYKVEEQLWLPKAVLQLAWRPRVRKGGEDDSDEGEKKQARELAIAGEDGSLRIYEFSL